MTDNWRLLAAGNEQAFLELFKNEYQHLFAYGFSITADRELTKDCIQELFLELWEKRSRVNNEVSNIRSYLFTWLRRKITHQLARKHNHAPGALDPEIAEPSYEELLVALETSAEKKLQLNEALSRLSRKQLDMVRLRFFQNMSYGEIAEKEQLSQRTVYNLVYEALKRLRQSIPAFLPFL